MIDSRGECMFQIYYMGKYRDESQLIKNQPYPEKATKFKESADLNKIMLQGMLIGLPLFLFMLIVGSYRIASIDYLWQWHFQWLTAGIVYIFLSSACCIFKNSAVSNHWVNGVINCLTKSRRFLILTSRIN